MNLSGRFTANNNWVIPISGMCLVLGLMISMASVTGSEIRKSRLRLTDPDLNQRTNLGSLDMQSQYRELQAEVNKIRKEKTELENAVANQNKGSQILNKQLQESKIFAGFTEVQGPGIMVTLSDSQPDTRTSGELPIQNTPDVLNEEIIHDQDVLRVVNELWASGAEAISINNFRLGPTSSIRCVGPVVHIDGNKVASPIKVRAIGDPETLIGAMKLPGGILETLQQVDPKMVKLEQVDLMTLPAYNGPTTRRFATPVTPKK